jgi:predicted dehydrogenase
MTQPVRIGIVGCGSVMQGAYMPLVERLAARGLATAVMACDLAETERERVRERFRIPYVTADYRDVVGSDEVDLVLVLTSMPAHGPITRAALEAGKHVLVEKPMAVTLPEAQAIMALARTSPGYLVCAPHIILSNTYQTMWRRIKRGDIGKPLSARAFYGWAGPDWRPWFYQRGGGSLFDLGVYNITSLTGLLGPARRIMAMAGIAIPEREVAGRRLRVEAEDNVHLLLDFGENVYAVVTTGFTMQKYRCAGIEVYGSAGTIQMIGEDWAPRGYELWQNSVGAWQLYENTDPTWHWSDGLRHIVECIRHRTPPLIRPEHAFHVLEIMLKAQESGRDGQAKPIESTFAPLAIGEAQASALPAHRRHDPARED